MCIFGPLPVTPRTSTIECGVHTPPVRGGVLHRTKLRDLAGNAVNPRLQVIGKRQLSKGATP
jgi:hypothetical protein